MPADEPLTASLDARLTAFQTAVSGLLEAEPQQALKLARDYQALAETSGRPAARAHSALLLARALMLTAELAPALAAAHSAAGCFQQAGDLLGQAEAQVIAGQLHLSLGELEAAAQMLRAAVEGAAALTDARAPAVQATALNHLSGVQHHQGQDSEALASLQGALQLWRQLENPSGQAHCLTNIGNIQTWLGQYHAAIQALTEAYGLYQQRLHDARSEAFILHSLAHLHHLQQDHALAVEVARSAVAAARVSQYSTLLATALLNLGTFALDAGELVEAEANLTEALDLSRACSYRVGELSSLDSLGALYEQGGQLARAEGAFQAALDIALEVQDLQGELDARLHLGRLLLRLGQPEDARRHLERSLDIALDSQHPSEAAQAHEALAQLAEQQGDFREVAAQLKALRSIERQLFDAERDRQTRNLTVQFEVERARHDAEVYRMRTEVEHEARRAAEQLVQERTAELARAQHEIVTRLAMAAEYRDDTTGEHTRRVGRSAYRIARALGWSEERAHVLGIAARLHDVGKIGIPDSVLLKEGKLSESEYAQMQTHTLIGARILSGGRSELLRLAEEIALTHHERWDGRGYPRGLSGEHIPETGRIVAVADVFDALTQARPYKRAWTTTEALSELSQQSGQQFDPGIVQTALDVLMGQPQQRPDDLDSPGAPADDLPLAEEDASHVLAVFEQLLVERTRDLEAARQQAELATQRMTRMALTDSLTGLANRRAFEGDLEAALAGVPQHCVAVVSFDLDGLKAANDTLGHDGGDAFLSSFGRHLARVFADVGRAYRIGGDEFALIASAAPPDHDIHQGLQTVLREVRTECHPTADASIGIARFPHDARTPGDLLRLSDRRMYQHKLNRRAAR